MSATIPPATDYMRAQPAPTALPFRVRTVGRIREAPWHSTLGTYHGDAMLTLFLAGRGAYRQSDRTLSVEAGMLGLVLPESDVGVLAADPADPYDHYYIRFAGAEALCIAHRFALRCPAPFSLLPGWQGLLPYLSRALEHFDSRTARDEYMRPVDGALAQLLVQLDNPVVEDVSQALTASSLRSYMENRLEEPMDIARMAGHFRVSKGHLCRQARRLLGGTLVPAWRTMKVGWARQLLADTDMTVDEVSRRVGFSSPFYFSTVFKQVAGCSPSQWRVDHG